MMTTIRTTATARSALGATTALALAGALFAAPSTATAATPSTTTAVTATAANNDPTLRQGSTGAAVREWQTVITYVLGDGTTVDGVFGPRTAAATREVQAMFGLVADGIVGPATRAATAVVHAPVDPAAVNGTVPHAPVDPAALNGSTDGAITDTVASIGHLERGDRGARVTQWQRLLDVDPRSTTATVADGVFGPATLASTKAFQSRYGLAADGVVGPLTRATMQQVRDDV